MHKRSYYIINAITLYRLVASLLLLYLILIRREDIFRWVLGFSFFTDAIDAILARKYKVASVMGSRLDSLADDLTVLMGIIGVAIFRPDFIKEHFLPLIILLVFYLAQTTMALVRYGRVSSFHTYLAKLAALSQGSFLILIYFLPQWPLGLFYIAVAITMLDLIEEIILVILLPVWQTDVKGLYWVLRTRTP